MRVHIKVTFITMIHSRERWVTTYITGVRLVAGEGFDVERVLEMREMGDLLTCCNAARMEVKMASATVEDGAAALLAAEVTDEEASWVWNCLKKNQSMYHCQSSSFNEDGYGREELPSFCSLLHSFFSVAGLAQASKDWGKKLLFILLSKRLFCPKKPFCSLLHGFLFWELGVGIESSLHLLNSCHPSLHSLVEKHKYEAGFLRKASSAHLTRQGTYLSEAMKRQAQVQREESLSACDLLACAEGKHRIMESSAAGPALCPIPRLEEERSLTIQTPNVRTYL